MKIAIIGPGALGCLLAASLGRANQTCLLDHNPDRATILNRQGLILEKEGLTDKIPVSASTDPKKIEGAELVLLCVKSHRVAAALRTTRPYLDQKTLFLALQNGIAHLSVIPELLSGIPWALGVTAQGATLAGVGHVIHRGEGLTRIGRLPEIVADPGSMEERISRAAAVLCSADIKTDVVPNILDHVWNKLLVNTGINALTAIYNCPNGALLESAETLDLMKAAIQEGKAVAEKSGVSIAGDPVNTAREVCQATGANISSMLQDVRAKRPTEIAAINGALINIADELNIPVPTNRKLVAKIMEIESNYDDFT